MRNGEICIGAGITFCDPLVSDALADSVDFFWIDLEHGSMSPELLNGHLLAARGRGVPAIVRVGAAMTPCIKPVLDSGADGILCPQVRSVADVQRVVDDCRYPPLGARGFGPRVPSNYGRDGGNDYVERANRDVFVAVQIENTDALAALDEIVAIEGLDSLALGPSDLAASLGHTNDLAHPEVEAAIDTIIAKAREAGLFMGAGMGPDPGYAAALARRGVQWLQVGGDYSYLVNYMEGLVGEVRLIGR